jgi:2-haloacid dehalogenase
MASHGATGRALTRPEVLVFDVNETLLDLAGLRPVFEAALGTAEPMGEWFARMLHGSLVSNHANAYRPFGTIGVEALLTVAKKRDVDLTTEQATEVVGTMRRLPPHPDVEPALAALAAAGYRMVTLTNGSRDAVTDQIGNAGFSGYFEALLSVDDVRRFKPAPEVYLMAAARLGVEIDELLMVAAHDWDILGARTVGCPGAYVERPGAVWGLPDPLPAIVGPDLGAVAETLVELAA